MPYNKSMVIFNTSVFVIFCGSLWHVGNPWSITHGWCPELGYNEETSVTYIAVHNNVCFSNFAQYSILTIQMVQKLNQANLILSFT